MPVLVVRRRATVISSADFGWAVVLVFRVVAAAGKDCATVSALRTPSLFTATEAVMGIALPPELSVCPGGTVGVAAVAERVWRDGDAKVCVLRILAKRLSRATSSTFCENKRSKISTVCGDS